MNLFAIPSVIAMAVNFSLGLYVILMNPKRIENQLFALMMASFVIWDIGEIIMRTYDNTFMAVGGAKLYVLGGFIAAPIYFVFTLSFPKRRSIIKSPVFMYTLLLIITIFAFICLFTDVLIVGVEKFEWGNSPVYASFFPIAVLFDIGFNLLGLMILITTFMKTKDYLVKKKAQFIILGTMFPVIFGGTTNLLLPLFGIPFVELASTFTIVMSVFIGYAIIKYKLMITPVIEKDLKTEMKYDLKRGHSYLVKEDNPRRSYDYFTDLITHGVKGLCITTNYPQQTREKYKIERTPILWITQIDMDGSIKPTNLQDLSHAVKEFLDNSRNSAIMIDGVETLVGHTNFEAVQRALEYIKDYIAMRNSILILPASPSTLSTQELKSLERRFTPLS